MSASVGPIVDLRHSVESVHATASKLDFTLHAMDMLIARSWIVHMASFDFLFPVPLLPCSSQASTLCVASGLLNLSFFMAGQADLSTCIEVTTFFPLGVQRFPAR